MGTGGCGWVCMGVVGYNDTDEQQENKTKRDTNGLRGFFCPCVIGKFPEKRHICLVRHTVVKG